MITLRSKQKAPSRKAMDAQEREAVAGARDALARVIADGGHADRSRAIESVRALDRGWDDKGEEWTVTYRLGRVYDARFDLLGGFRKCTDRLPATASTQMQAALYGLDHLANVLLTRLAAEGVAIYPTLDDAPNDMLELPRAERDALLDAVDQGPAD